MQDDPNLSEASPPNFGDVPVLVTVTVGRAKPTIETLLHLSDETIIELDRGIDDPVELYVGDKLIARGTLEEVSDSGETRIGVRITDVLRPGGGPAK